MFKKVALLFASSLCFLSANSAEIKFADADLQNLECAIPVSVVLEKAHDAALQSLGDPKQYQQLSEWKDDHYFFNKNGWATDHNSDECASQRVVTSAFFVEKNKANEDRFYTDEWCGLFNSDFSDEENWAHTFKDSEESTIKDVCHSPVEVIWTEKIGKEKLSGHFECLHYKARYKCLK